MSAIATTNRKPRVEPRKFVQIAAASWGDKNDITWECFALANDGTVWRAGAPGERWNCIGKAPTQ